MLTVGTHNNADQLSFREPIGSFILFGKLGQVFWIHRETDCVKRKGLDTQLVSVIQLNRQMSVKSQLLFPHLHINLPTNYVINLMFDADCMNYTWIC